MIDCPNCGHRFNPRSERKLRVLDLFCGAGGASRGYSLAGFEVVGVDIVDQPHYPFAMFRDDALDWDAERIVGFEIDAIHASPPCQHYSATTAWRGDRGGHPDLIGETRKILKQTGLPYVIESIPGARRELVNPVMLCGTQFELRVIRHRLFETNWLLPLPAASCNHDGILPFGHTRERAFTDAMGCYWMSNMEGRQAIPPRYTEHIGTQLLEAQFS